MRIVALTVAVLALLVAGCNRAAQDPVAQPTAGDTEVAVTDPPAEAPTTEPAEVVTAAPTEDASEAPGPGQEVELWFVRDSGSAWLEPEVHTLPKATPGVARASIELLLAASPDDPGLANLMPPGTKLLDVVLRDKVLTVDLDLPDDHLNVGSAFEVAAVGQIVHTAAQFDTVKRVLILEEGGPLGSGHSDWSKPQRRDPFAVAPIIVTSPSEGETVSGNRIELTGTANVYEATVELRLVNPTGDVVKETFTTATCGTGCRGDWSHTFKAPSAGKWTVVAAASDPSDGEGNPPYEVKRTITVE